MPSSVEKARATYRMYGGTTNISRFRRDISSITLVTALTSTPSLASWAVMRCCMSARAASRSSATLNSAPYRSRHSSSTRPCTFLDPPPADSCRSTNASPSPRLDCLTRSSWSAGVKPSATKSSGIAS
eukprot:scaffold13228_cov112-Isochrysis_galbana.AAC.3